MNSLSNAVIATSNEEKIGEVAEELNLLIGIREMLQKQHEMLEMRIGGVLAQRAEGSGGSPSTPDRVRVPLAQGLHVEVSALTDLSNKLQSTINRIEL